MTMTTTAQMAADQVSGCSDERSLDSLCKTLGGSLTHERDERGERVTEGASAWEFDDGSAIVSAGNGWDVRAEGCNEFCWDGVGCTCDDGAA